MADALTHMIEALGLEIAAIRKKGNSQQLTVRGGERLQTEGTNTLYRFPLSEDIEGTQLKDDSPIRLACGKDDIPGIIVSTNEGILIVALEADLGDSISSARIIIDNSFLLERLKERLGEVQSGEAAFNATLAEKAIGEGHIASADAELDEALLLEGMNEEKQRIIRRSLGSEVTYVWGPPGTGKTTTLARVVEGFYRKGLSVLLVSNTNIAVDTALEKVAERLVTDEEYQRGAVIRLGPAMKEELIEKHGKQVLIDEIVERLSEGLQAERQKLVLEISHLEGQIHPMQEAIRFHQALKDVEKNADYAAKNLHTNQQKRAGLAAKISQYQRKKDALEEKLGRAKKSGPLKRIVMGLHPEKIMRDMGQADIMRKSCMDAAAEIDKAVAHAGKEAKETEELLKDIQAKLKEHPNVASYPSAISTTEKQLENLRVQMKEIDTQLAAMREEVLKNCRILATTVYRTFLESHLHREFDVVIVDEASMVMLPMTYYACGLATQSVVIAGDFRQLSPIVMSNEPEALEWLKKDVFEMAGIPKKVQSKKLPEYLCALQIQFRMKAAICDCINEHFYYDHPLIPDESIKKNISKMPLSKEHLLYIDTSAFHPWASMKLGGYSRYNLFHALLIRNIVSFFAQKKYLPKADEENTTLGIVSPYSAQTKLIASLVEDKLGRPAAFASTVHRFQGNEKETMIVDLTDSEGVRLGKFLSATQREEEGGRLLNVAFSRAKEHIILVANFEFLRKTADDDTLVLSILKYFEKHGSPLDVRDLLPIGDQDWHDALERMTKTKLKLDMDSAGAFNEGSFYPAFTQDIQKAEKSITIFSPFVTLNGLSRWVELFKDAQRRGVVIRLVFRPIEELGEIMANGLTPAVQALIDTGVTVDLRSKMHEKICVIDDSILWHGSLNILSHTNSSESMLRIPGKKTCSQISQLVCTPSGGKSISIHEKENPLCDDCNGETVWKNGKFGVYFECSECGAKTNARNIRKQKTESIDITSLQHYECPLPGCGGTMKPKKGRYGVFFGCSKYPACKNTEKIRIGD